MAASMLCSVLFTGAVQAVISSTNIKNKQDTLFIVIPPFSNSSIIISQYLEV
jgi:hypothetical protein